MNNKLNNICIALLESNEFKDTVLKSFSEMQEKEYSIDEILNNYDIQQKLFIHLWAYYEGKNCPSDYVTNSNRKWCVEWNKKEQCLHDCDTCWMLKELDE